MQAYTFVHFVSGTLESARLPLILVRMMRHLKERFALRLPVPYDLVGVPAAFSLMCETLRLIGVEATLIIDGCDALIFDEVHTLGAESFWVSWRWLPDPLPPNIAFVFSFCTGSSHFENLSARRSLHIVKMRWVRDDPEYVMATVSKVRLKLGTGLSAHVRQRYRDEIPLLIECCLRECSSGGNQQTAPRLSRTGLTSDADEKQPLEPDLSFVAGNMDAMWDAIIAKWEAFMSTQLCVMQDVFTLLYCARRGLAEFELLCLVQVCYSMIA
jgi:hypothetical protein